MSDKNVVVKFRRYRNGPWTSVSISQGEYEIWSEIFDEHVKPQAVERGMDDYSLSDWLMLNASFAHGSGFSSISAYFRYMFLYCARYGKWPHE